jgi:2-polyprenyl-3-methyl-5-hydroxy-6-metoxy-1,4-benzoquinol methylase
LNHIGPGIQGQKKYYKKLFISMSVPLLYGLILKTALPAKKLRILELGCGKGDIGETIQQSNLYEITGVDLFKPYAIPH